ncbi:MAG: bifunctional 2-C-methyl-D-erythritol 4-phosphate cytidylyltransferase/2-C-methyl-D-erythritol 2,4-cyclodiphosphate synthase [Pseudomonadota bacterium]
MTTAVIIVAAGRGTRAGSIRPKQYVELAGKPILRHTLEAVLDSQKVDHIQPVIHLDDHDSYQEAVATLSDARILDPVDGGSTRTASVQAGLKALKKENPEIVLIHDAARPFVTPENIQDVISAVGQQNGAFLAVPVVDTVWRQGNGLDLVERSNLWRAQTPQGFPYRELLAAYAKTLSAESDDVGIAIASGIDVVPVQSTERNFKITRPEDFLRAEKELGSTMDIRTGNAFDVHAFGDGDHVILNGVKIPHSNGLKGHSDADVAMHALTDAIFGALCEGDIGQWFPPSDAQWKGAASDIFLKKAVSCARKRGFTITHLDCTIICEFPKIGPHSDAMRRQIAAICGLEMERISVKATTSEQLGFTGRGEGIASIATATLVAK